jgi:hypothetical protein
VVYFEDKILLGTLDEASSNPRYVHNLRKLCHGWTDISIGCEDHAAYNVGGDMAKLHEADVSGLTHWGLAMNHPMGRRFIATILKQIVGEWLNIRRGPPPAHARHRTFLLLRVALAGERNLFERKLHMLFFPNGDPWIRGRIDVWIPVGAVVDRARLVLVVFKSLNYSLFSKQIPILNKSRWRGLYPASSAFILQDRVLGSLTFFTFMFFKQGRQCCLSMGWAE